MPETWTSFIVGLFIGANVGIIVAALLISTGQKINDITFKTGGHF